MLTDDQRQVLRLALDPLMPMPKKLVLEFFDGVFQLDPGLEQQYRPKLDEMAGQFAVALSGGIVHLIDDGNVSDAIRQLGVKLRGWGVIEHDYDTFGRALTALFEKRLGADFTPEGRAAWEEAWDLLATEMQKAAIVAAEGG